MTTVDRRGLSFLSVAQSLARDCSPTANQLLFTGMDGRDIDIFIKFTLTNSYLIIFRQPHEHANASREMPKPSGVKDKSSEFTGEVQDKKTGRVYRSDYDLMSIHKVVSEGSQRTFVKINASWAPGRPMTEEENQTIRALNNILGIRSGLQHGCNDDWVDENGSPINKNVGNDFISFDVGKPIVTNFLGLKQLYKEYGLKFHNDYSLNVPASDERAWQYRV